MEALSLQLEPYQKETLEAMRDRHPIPYLRERAAALLKIAAGQTATEVAQSGLLKSRKADTVRGWIKAYQRFGLGSLYQQPRRRRHFSPSAGGRAVEQAASSAPAIWADGQPMDLSSDPEDGDLAG